MPTNCDGATSSLVKLPDLEEPEERQQGFLKEKRRISPKISFTEPAFGDMPDDLMFSPRIAPHMVGLGLLEAIPEERLKELEDPDDIDGDGISGRIQWLSIDEGVIGRFGWKGDSPDVEQQSAEAFAGDIGLTSSIQPYDDCTEAQNCSEEMSGGYPEVSDLIMERTVLYSRTIAVPVRRTADDRDVLRGKALFSDINCSGCHTPSMRTR